MKPNALLPLLLSVASAASSIVLATADGRSAPVAAFGDRHHALLTLENVGGFVHLKQSFPDRDLAGGENYLGTFVVAPLSRLGVHGVVGGGVTLGTGFSISSLDRSGGGSSTTVWALAPRIGYVVKSGDKTAFWFRAGFTYFHQSVTGGGLWQLSPAAEVNLVLTPFDHFGVMIGAMIEWGVAGKQTYEGSGFRLPADEAYRLKMYGLTLGFVFDL